MIDKILTLVPVNRTAGMVTSSGQHYECSAKNNEYETDIPIPTRLVPQDDLTGRRFGRFTVIGLSLKRSRWVVRCDCGVYTLRKAKAIKNMNNDFDCCKECKHLLYLKRHDIWKRTGKDYHVRDL